MPSPIPGANGAFETRPREALKPSTPQHEPGMRSEPPPSEPCEIAHRPAASAAAAPPLEPPAFRERSHGVRQGPFRAESVNAVVPNSGVFVLPRITKPGRPELGDVSQVEVGDVGRERGTGERRPDAGRRVEILERDRDSVERRLGRRVRLRPRVGERLVAAHRDVRAELRVQALDPLEVELDELERRHLSLPNEASLLGRREERELHPGDRIRRSQIQSKVSCRNGTRKYRRNAADAIHMNGCTSLGRPCAARTVTKARKPIPIPRVIENVNGMNMIVSAAASPIPRSVKSMPGELAAGRPALGVFLHLGQGGHHQEADEDQRGRRRLRWHHADDRGEEHEREEQRPATTATQPVRPPTPTPDADSM